MVSVILSGGSGTRLWPVSRASYPKQFCDFYDRSFLRESLERLKVFGDTRVLTIESMRNLTLRAGVDFDLNSNQMIFEPMAKNTAPAIALLCHLLSTENQNDQLVGVFPSDHLIADTEGFLKAVETAQKLAQLDYIVTLGIQPSYPATGYGYIELAEDLSFEKIQSAEIIQSTEKKIRAFKVASFREKPDLALAKEFVGSGRFVWNAGMFVFKVSTMIEAFRHHLPLVWAQIEKIKPDLSNAKIQYANCDSVSIDYGVMEKATNLACVEGDFGWSDVGSWDEISRLAEEHPQLKAGANVQVFTEVAANNYVFSVKPKVVGLVGVKNLIVVDTPDALLIAQKGQTQKVKELLEQIREAGLVEATDHPFEFRPWGGFELLADQKDFKAKRVTVDAKQQLSYQSHTERAEHWVVISGEAVVVLEGKEYPLRAGESIFIPRGAKHRIRNVGNSPLIFVEIQTGTYFGEDDIERFEDDYERV